MNEDMYNIYNALTSHMNHIYKLEDAVDKLNNTAIKKILRSQSKVNTVTAIFTTIAISGMWLQTVRIKRLKKDIKELKDRKGVNEDV